MISMPEIKKGNNSANNVSGVNSFNPAKWLVMLYIVPNFVKLSQTVSKLYRGHDFYTENYKGE